MRCNYRCNMWCHCKKPAKPYPPISVESVGIVGWDASGTQTFQAQDNPYYASFSIEVLPADATNKMVTITSSNTRVINWATYDSSDVTFTIEGEGEAEVTITSQSNPEVSTTYSVTVTPAAEPFEPNNSMYLIQTRNTKKTRSAGDVDATVRFFAEDENSTDYVQAQFGNNNKLTYVSYHGACEGNEYCEEIFDNEDIKTELGAAIGGYIAEHGIPAVGVLQFGPEVRDAIEGVFNETGEVSDITTAIEEAQDVVEPSIITITIVHNASNVGYLTDDMGNEIQLPYTFTVPEPVTIDDNLDGGHELSVYGVDSGDDYGSFFPIPNEDGGPEDGGYFTGWACNGLVMHGPVDVYEDTTVVASWQETQYYNVTFSATEGGEVDYSERNVEEGSSIVIEGDSINIGGITVQATSSDPGYSFTGWTLANGDSVPQTVISNLSIVAHFELECDVCDDQCPDFDPCECDPCSDPDCPHFDIVDCGCVGHINNNPFDSQTVEISLGGNATYQFIPDFNSAVCTEPYGLYTSSSDIRVAEPSLSWDGEYSTLLIEAIGPGTCTIYLSDDDGHGNTYQLNVTVPQEATGDILFYATDKNGDPFVIMAPTEEDSSKAIGYVFCKLTDGASENNVNVYYDGPVQDVQVTFRENLDYDEHVAESESESWEYIIIVDGNWSDIDDAYWGDDAGSIVVELNNEEYATIPLISCKKFLYMTDFDCSTTPTTEIYFSISDKEEPDGVILNPDGEWGYRGLMTTPTMNWLFEKYVSEGNQMNLSAMIAASMQGDPCGQWDFNSEFIERLGYLMARDTAEERGYMADFLEGFGENGNLLDGRGGE